MNPSIKQLQAFVIVSRSRSLAQASERLHLSQPAISIALKNLEEQVGGKLFSRDGRQLSLTPEGRDFLPTAQRLLQDWQEAFDDLGALFSKQRGKVTIAALPTLAAGLVPGVIAEFHRHYPRINLSLHDVLADEVTGMVRDERADFGLSVPPRDAEDLDFTPIIDDQNVVVCAQGHPLLEHREVAWRLLADYPFIGIHRQSSSRQQIDQLMEDIGCRLDILCDASQIATVGRMVAAGLGISVLPSLSFRQISLDGLDYRPLVEPRLPRHLGIITRRHAALSSAAVALLAMLRSAASDMEEIATGSTREIIPPST
ncbi:LysR family transcriptional regulator [Halomonas cupida]|uniref:Transcriptional regulator n=1 Tax=Halomonas cupida TaxID=44933 RepID=A0A1M7CD63_9GAMM|nr:LysR family transcriptional regulator [Halomonas cupida]GEN25111.1 transcriptional regulator [Halomonas cupida]SHL65097.1 LysR family transcriptional regulator, carnitine catabolism transcriptional activator [Halomonas cupida]